MKNYTLATFQIWHQINYFTVPTLPYLPYLPYLTLPHLTLRSTHIPYLMQGCFLHFCQLKLKYFTLKKSLPIDFKKSVFTPTTSPNMEQALSLATCRACYLPFFHHGSA